jgi:hypothetical protein
MFGAEFFKNALLVFTKFANDERSISQRQTGNKMNEDKVIEEYSRHFREKFKFELNRNQFCFIDNYVDDDARATDLEK